MILDILAYGILVFFIGLLLFSISNDDKMKALFVGIFFFLTIIGSIFSIIWAFQRILS